MRIEIPKLFIKKPGKDNFPIRLVFQRLLRNPTVGALIIETDKFDTESWVNKLILLLRTKK